MSPDQNDAAVAAVAAATAAAHLITQSTAGVLDRLKTIENHVENIRRDNREDHGKIFDILTDMEKHGTAISRKNSEDIEDLQNRPDKLLGTGAVIISILVGIKAFLFPGHG